MMVILVSQMDERRERIEAGKFKDFPIGFFDSRHDMASHQWQRLCLGVGDVSVVFVSTDELR